MKNDLVGNVLYIPTQPGDSWIIYSEDRLFYIQTFLTISKQFKAFPEILAKTENIHGGLATVAPLGEKQE